MPWLSKVKAVLQMFHPGQEGDGPRPTFFWATHVRRDDCQLRIDFRQHSMTRNPAYPGRVNGPNGTANFSEGLNIGYRWYKQTNTPVLFPFGYGLSYTNFSYSGLAVTHTRSGLEVSFWLENVGRTASTEVPQVYVDRRRMQARTRNSFAPRS